MKFITIQNSTEHYHFNVNLISSIFYTNDHNDYILYINNIPIYFHTRDHLIIAYNRILEILNS